MCECFHAHKIKLCFMPLTPAQPFKDTVFNTELAWAHVTMFIGDVIFNIMGIYSKQLKQLKQGMSSAFYSIL